MIIKLCFLQSFVLAVFSIRRAAHCHCDEFYDQERDLPMNACADLLIAGGNLGRSPKP